MKIFLIFGLFFCFLLNFCNCETTTEAVEDETVEEPLLSTLDIVVLTLAGKLNGLHNIF